METLHSHYTIVERAAICVLTHNPLDHRLHEAHLEVKRRLHTHESQPEQTVTQALWQPGYKALEYQRELTVSKQVVKRLLHL